MKYLLQIAYDEFINSDPGIRIWIESRVQTLEFAFSMNIKPLHYDLDLAFNHQRFDSDKKKTLISRLVGHNFITATTAPLCGNYRFGCELTITPGESQVVSVAMLAVSVCYLWQVASTVQESCVHRWQHALA